MDSRDYGILYDSLRVDSDLVALGAKHNLETSVLKAILHQKIVRDTMHHHHKIQSKAKELKKQWDKGETIMEISKQINFAPVMTAWLILESKGISRPQFRAMTKNPEKITDSRIRKELAIAVEKDLVYSPHAVLDQMTRSKKTEETVREWLSKKNTPYIDEQEAKERKHAKTPDFLLKKTLTYNGVKIHWVECKASFGDEYETRRDYNKQLKHYVELHGTGMVVYQYGFIDGIELENITLATIKDLKD